MSNLVSESIASVSTGKMWPLIVAQFCSAFGDNALLLVLFGLFRSMHYSELSNSLLQLMFLVPYVIFAPFLGRFADIYPKKYVLMVGNAAKLLGGIMICVGLDPFVAFALVGFGASVYAPAKYGILPELVTEDRLVTANGLIEGTTILAIILGTVSGGLLADWNLRWAVVISTSAFLLALVCNLFIPYLSAFRPGKLEAKMLLTNYKEAFVTLLSDGQARASILGTTMLWSFAVVVRLLLLLWIPAVLLVDDNATPSSMIGIFSVGIIIGAVLAPKLIPLNKVHRALPLGLMMALIVVFFSLQASMVLSYVLLVVIGAIGGMYIIPMNALLQERGCKTVGTGNAVAIQAFCENLGMLTMVGVFSLMSIYLHPSLIGVILGVGLFVGILLLIFSAGKLLKAGESSARQ